MFRSSARFFLGILLTPNEFAFEFTVRLERICSALYRHTIERHRSVSQSSERQVYQEYHYSGDRTPAVFFNTPPISPLSHSDSHNSDVEREYRKQRDAGTTHLQN
uniref:Uncharacterized protein n=1 Tax=Caenorhabditis japonica TaxID=281687 RepID=A0A8R1EDE7_CAEJA